MDLDGETSSTFNGDTAAEFAGEEEKIPPPSSVEEMLIDMGGGAEKLNFSDKDDVFPSLADFGYIPSPSASASFSSAASTLPNRSNSSSSSSSSFSSSSPWSFLLGQSETGAEGASEEPLVSSMDAGFDFLADEIDLWGAPIESTWDSSQSFFPAERNDFAANGAANAEKVGFLSGGDDCPTEDLAKVFLDWLKINKDWILPEDLKRIKLKRSTIECAARRLGGGKQGRVQLLKLILDWVQNHHLKKKRKRDRLESEAAATVQELQNNPPPPPLFPPPQIATTSNTNIDLYFDAVPCNSYAGDSVFPPNYIYCNDQAFLPQPWQQGFSPGPTSSVIHYSQIPAPPLPVYNTGQMASVTKEARKKRMARQRKSCSLHHYKSQQHQQQNDQQSFDTTHVVTDEISSNKDNCSKFSFLSTNLTSDMPSASSPPAMARMQEDCFLYKRAASPIERRRDDVQEGMKSENSYKFLLRKVLKQSDVGSLGRIVLPKKEAEIHLPALDARDGMTIEMEDIGASRVWNMRYRFWPNNKSRMYVLENTGDFVRSNGLQEGDFIVIYSDAKCGKYMIRGVKVRQAMDAMKVGSNRGKGADHKEINGSSKIDEKGKSLC